MPLLEIMIKSNNQLEYNYSLSNIIYLKYVLSLNSTSNEFLFVSAYHNVFDRLLNEQLKNISLYEIISQGKLLCLLVLFRSRFSTLFQFLPYLHEFLVGQHSPHLIFILHQTDDLRYALEIRIKLKVLLFEYSYLFLFNISRLGKFLESYYSLFTCL